jgi:hypothetical protein
MTVHWSSSAFWAPFLSSISPSRQYTLKKWGTKFRIESQDLIVVYSGGTLYQSNNHIQTELKPSGQPPCEWSLLKAEQLHLQCKLWATKDDLKIYSQDYSEYLNSQ